MTRTAPVYPSTCRLFYEAAESSDYTMSFCCFTSEFNSLAPDYGIKVLAYRLFPTTDGRSDTGGANIIAALSDLKTAGVRVILGHFVLDDAQDVLRLARSLGMTGANGYVWVGTDGWTKYERRLCCVRSVATCSPISFCSDNVMDSQSSSTAAQLENAVLGVVGTRPVDYATSFASIWDPEKVAR